MLPHRNSPEYWTKMKGEFAGKHGKLHLYVYGVFFFFRSHFEYLKFFSTKKGSDALLGNPLLIRPC